MFDLDKQMLNRIKNAILPIREPAMDGPQIYGTSCNGACQNNCWNSCAGGCKGSCTRSCTGRMR